MGRAANSLWSHTVGKALQLWKLYELTREKRGDRVFVVWRCNKSNCEIERSVRSDCCFFAFKRLDGKLRSSLSLREIMEIVYLFLNTSPNKVELRKNTGRSSSSIIDWCSLCREVCIYSIENSPKLISTSEAPVQIDELSFGGRRKYNKGRILRGDIEFLGSNKHGRSRYNYVNRLSGPSVLGIYQSKENVRFIVIPDRSANTLVPLIKKYVAAGSTIVTDEWAAYRQLRNVG